MTATHKPVTIDFFQGDMAVDARAPTVWAVLTDLAGPSPVPCDVVGANGFEVRRLRIDPDGQGCRGEFAKIRQGEIPHAGAPGGLERELELAEDEGLVEKNFFYYVRERGLLLYQKNGHASAAARFAQYLSVCSGETVAFNPVLQPDPLRRLLRGEVHARVIKMTLARPTNPELIPANSWNQDVLGVLQGAGGVSMSLEIRGNGRSQDPGQRYLYDRIKAAVAELLDLGPLRSATISVEDEGGAEVGVIDLIRDRLSSVQHVEKVGKYFVPASMYAALRLALVEKSTQLTELFGHGSDSLA